MPDIISVLERAAAVPTRAPDLDRPHRRTRARRIALVSAALVILLAASLSVFALSSPHRVTVRVVATPSTSTTSQPGSGSLQLLPTYHDAKNHFAIGIFDGWRPSSGTLAPWLHSPHEILSLATVPLAPSSLPGNQAACPSEVPKVVVEGIGHDGAFVGIYEWIKGEGVYSAEPWPAGGAGSLHWGPGCRLATGAPVQIATFTRNGRDFSVTKVLGPGAVSADAEIDAMLNSFAPTP